MTYLDFDRRHIDNSHNWPGSEGIDEGYIVVAAVFDLHDDCSVRSREPRQTLQATALGDSHGGVNREQRSQRDLVRLPRNGRRQKMESPWTIVAWSP